jgi:hypothetical protein
MISNIIVREPLCMYSHRVGDLNGIKSSVNGMSLSL